MFDDRGVGDQTSKGAFHYSSPLRCLLEVYDQQKKRLPQLWLLSKTNQRVITELYGNHCKDNYIYILYIYIHILCIYIYCIYSYIYIYCIYILYIYIHIYIYMNAMHFLDLLGLVMVGSGGSLPMPRLSANPSTSVQRRKRQTEPTNAAQAEELRNPRQPPGLLVLFSQKALVCCWHWSHWNARCLRSRWLKNIRCSSARPSRMATCTDNDKRPTSLVSLMHPWVSRIIMPKGVVVTPIPEEWSRNRAWNLLIPVPRAS